MGGFSGFIEKSGELNPDENILNQMNAKIIHRGICDPVYSEDKNLVIFCDCGMYKAEEILSLYEKHGEKTPGMLRGAFSFVIYDKTARALYGARDHFGIKPFYYCPIPEKELFIFGSEIKSLLPHPEYSRELNKNALKIYLTFQYSALDETFFKNIRRLPPGCFFTYKNAEFKITRYFDISYETAKKPFAEYCGIIDKTLRESIKYYKADSTEIGSFLSGGVDSSFIASVSLPKKTFSVGFDREGFDESVLAGELAGMLKIENYKKIISPDEFFDALPRVQYLCDEPYANLSGVPLYFLAELAAAHVKTALSGEGADEFFSGYLPFAESRFVSFYEKLPFGLRKLIKNLIKPLPDFKGKATLKKYGQKVEDYYIGQAFIMDDSEANDILSEKYRSDLRFKDVTAPYFERVRDKSDLIKKSYLDLFLWLPGDILLKGDRMASAHNIEVRAPILDKEVFSVSSKIPKKYLIKNKVTKYIFREVANKYIPANWAKRKKLGFPVPFTFWLRERPYYEKLKEMFCGEFVSEFFVREKLLAMLDEHFTGAKNNGRKLYTVYAFLIWYKIYFGEEKII